jgi:hypothetical protein
MDHDVFDPIHYEDIPLAGRGNIIPSHMFIKEKIKPDGTFDKTKGRHVLNGDRQNPAFVGETKSPTVNPISVKIQLNLCASEEASTLTSMDFPSAFLIPKIAEDKVVIMLIPKQLVSFWLKLYPSLRSYVSQKNGCLYVRLKKWLYGSKEAPKAFHDYLDKYLKSIGFKPTPLDKCFYSKPSKDGIILISVHVDDLLLTTPNIVIRNQILKTIKLQFHNITIQHDSVDYLGMKIVKHRNGSITINQQGYIQKLIDQYGTTKSIPPTPAISSDLLNHDNDNGALCNSKRYLSLIMSLMFLGRFTRSDILHATTYLATKSSNPTMNNWRSAIRIVDYLRGNSKAGITILNPDMKLRIFADASHAIHKDGKGHGGIIITLGSSPIMTKSYKLKMVTKSSTESELVTLDEALTYGQYIQDQLEYLRINGSTKVICYQDNQSTISMIHTGGNFNRTKHNILVRLNYVKDMVSSGGRYHINYIPTTRMIADYHLTKPLSQPQHFPSSFSIKGTDFFKSPRLSITDKYHG